MPVRDDILVESLVARFTVQAGSTSKALTLTPGISDRAVYIQRGRTRVVSKLAGAIHHDGPPRSCRKIPRVGLKMSC